MAQKFATAEFGEQRVGDTGLTISTTQKHSGTSSYTLSTGATNQQAYWNTAGGSQPAIRAYVYVTAFTANLYRNHLVWLTNSSNNGLIGFKINASQNLTLVSGSDNGALTTLGTSTQTFPLNSWVRLEIRVTGANSYSAAWYSDNATTANDTFTGTNSSVTLTSPTYYCIGSPTTMGGYAAQGYWDDLAVASVSEFIGPATAILQNTWEGMTSGQTLDTTPTGGNGNTPINSYNGTFGGVAATTYAHSGTLSLRQPIGTNQSWQLINVRTGLISARSYFYFSSSISNADLLFMSLTSDGSFGLTVGLGVAGGAGFTDNGFYLVGGTAANVFLGGTTQNFLNTVLNQWIRIEVSYNYTSGAWTFAIYANDATTALFSTSGTSTNNMPTTALNRVDIGKLQNNASTGSVTNYWTDDVALTTASTNAIGPYSTTPVTTQVVTNQSATYNVYTSVTSTGPSSTWNVGARVTSNQNSTFGIGGRVVSSQSSTYNALVGSSKQEYLYWNVQETITSPRSSTWNVAGSTSSDKPSTWDVRLGAQSNVSSTYAVVQSVTTSQSSTFTVNAQVVASNPSTWGVAGSTRSDAQSTWSVRASVVSNQPGIYDVLRVVPQSRESFWSVNTVVTSTQSASYNVASVVTSSQASTYGQTQTISKNQAATWDAEIGAASSIESTFDTLTTTTATLPTNWDVKVAVGSSVSSTYDTRAQIVGSQGSIYAVVGRVVTDLGSTWAVDKIGTIKVYSNTPSTYDVRERILAKQPTSFDVLTSLSVNVPSQWADLYAVAPKSQTTTWDTAAITWSHVESDWAVRRRVRHRQSVNWNVLGPADVIPVIGTIAKAKVIAFTPENKPVVRTSKQSVKVTVQQTIRIGEL